MEVLLVGPATEKKTLSANGTSKLGEPGEILESNFSLMLTDKFSERNKRKKKTKITVKL